MLELHSCMLRHKKPWNECWCWLSDAVYGSLASAPCSYTPTCTWLTLVLWDATLMLQAGLTQHPTGVVLAGINVAVALTSLCQNFRTNTCLLSMRLAVHQHPVLSWDSVQCWLELRMTFMMSCPRPYHESMERGRIISCKP